MSRRGPGNEYTTMRFIARMGDLMKTSKWAWGLGRVVALVCVGGCSGSLNEVGQGMGGTAGRAGDSGTAGSADQAGTANSGGRGGTEEGGYAGTEAVSGSGGTSYDSGGTSYDSGGTSYDSGGTTYDSGGTTYGSGGTSYDSGGTSYGGNDLGGSGGTSWGGTGWGGTGWGGNGGPGCFDPFDAVQLESQLDLAPQNAVLLDVHVARDQVVNSAQQLLFPNSFNGQWEAYANFPAVSAELSGKTDIALPAELSALPDNLAQFFVSRRNCAGETVAGRKLLVEVWWKGGPTIAPTHGVALGIYDGTKKATTWLDDATKSYVVGGPTTKRILDTLNRVQLSHTFAASDKTDARQIVLGLWLASEVNQPTTFYVGNVSWN
jgi:hypothetical protein